MDNRWDDTEVGADQGDAALCAYASRLIGSEPRLVVHGGGNSSYKTRRGSLEVLAVKGSGSDMATLMPDDFVALDLERVREMAAAPELSDVSMARQLRRSMLDDDAPSPSVESLLHAVISANFVLHAHPNAVLALSNTADGPQRVGDLYGNRVVVVPYARPGFSAARATIDSIAGRDLGEFDGIVLLNHGLFTFGDTARQAYDRMIDLVSMAEVVLEKHTPSPTAPASMPAQCDRVGLAELRAEVSEVAGVPVILQLQSDPIFDAWLGRDDLESVARRGVATPDHAIWTKRIPMVGRDVTAFARDYVEYFDHCSNGRDLQMLDPAPRIIVDPSVGVIAAGCDVDSAIGAAAIYTQTVEVINASEALGGFDPLPAQDVFELEYWDLEQAKLDRADSGGRFRGEVAVVTGANSGIGRACAERLLADGAAVVGLDISDEVTDTFDEPGYIGVRCDVTASTSISDALDAGVARFGGVDMVVAAAGVFPESSSIADLQLDAWRRVMAVNVDGLVALLAAVHPLLVHAPRGGRVAVIGSKNVVAPGPGASAYSASKAAAQQVARVAALEWAGDGIRVNSVHPDAVFDTGLWTPELLAERAANYGMSIDEYRRRNLLQTEITSADVGAIVADLLSSTFATVTGAQIPIDGGNARVI